MTIAVAIATAVAGFVVGVFSALFGVGGGILMVPFLVLGLGLSQHVAEGTSLLVIVPTALVGAVAHAKRGYVDAKAAAALAIGGVIGAVTGAILGLGLSADVLRRLFAVLVAIVGVRLIRDGLQRGKS